MLLLNMFFFKQKTAYELRISDWSSDVCSSDLAFDQQIIAPGESRGIAAVGEAGRSRQVAAEGVEQAEGGVRRRLAGIEGEALALGEVDGMNARFRCRSQRAGHGDRKRVVWGKSVSVRVDLGVRRHIEKKTR